MFLVNYICLNKRWTYDPPWGIPHGDGGDGDGGDGGGGRISQPHPTPHPITPRDSITRSGTPHSDFFN